MNRHPLAGLVPPPAKCRWTWFDYYLKWSPRRKFLAAFLPGSIWDSSHIPYPEERNEHSDQSDKRKRRR